MFRCGLWASSGPFPLSAHYGLYKRGRDPPQTLAVIWRKKGVNSLSSGCSRKIKKGDQPPPPPPPPLPHNPVLPPCPPSRPPPPLTLVTFTLSCKPAAAAATGRRRHRRRRIAVPPPYPLLGPLRVPPPQLTPFSRSPSPQPIPTFSPADSSPRKSLLLCPAPSSREPEFFPVSVPPPSPDFLEFPSPLRISTGHDPSSSPLSRFPLLHQHQPLHIPWSEFSGIPLHVLPITRIFHRTSISTYLPADSLTATTPTLLESPKSRKTPLNSNSALAHLPRILPLSPNAPSSSSCYFPKSPSPLSASSLYLVIPETNGEFPAYGISPYLLPHARVIRSLPLCPYAEEKLKITGSRLHLAHLRLPSSQQPPTSPAELPSPNLPKSYPNAARIIPPPADFHCQIILSLPPAIIEATGPPISLGPRVIHRHFIFLPGCSLRSQHDCRPWAERLSHVPEIKCTASRRQLPGIHHLLPWPEDIDSSPPLPSFFSLILVVLGNPPLLQTAGSAYSSPIVHVAPDQPLPSRPTGLAPRRFGTHSPSHHYFEVYIFFGISRTISATIGT